MTRLETRLIHAGEPRLLGAVAMPIFQSSTYIFGGEKSYHDIRYLRLNNTPSHTALHAKLASLESAEAAVATASGMAAISTALLTFLAPGDHLLLQDGVYGGTHDFVTQELMGLGVTHDSIDAGDPASWEPKLRSRTRAVYVETLSNPLWRVGDLESLVAFARKHDLVSMIDNTAATPLNFRPMDHGFDVCLHSCTKYLNGHSDIVAGAVIGKASNVEKITRRLNHLGGCLDPHAAFLLHRGLKTLGVRVREQERSAIAISRSLESHPAVARVHYPGLESHPDHTRARRLLQGFGGMLSFELHGGLEAAERLIGSMKLAVDAPSFGGPESLVTRPATTSHAGMSPEVRRRQGISDSLVRFSTGLEAAEDLIEDLDQALRR